ncbi:anthranilate phosphoribosyltransferase [Brackiella oedipodis]|uniref:anthranilate phosphoribosyltransferase n=1 Tax=Brackiella oedipodis TaxID=124225 RepID=UPI00048B35DE|nr:anthranilate phosphoribosyltransferase [Brackiella oedipodis]
MAISYQEALTRCIEHREIFEDEMLDLFRDLMAGRIPDPLAAAILIGLRVKKETIDEIKAAALVMRECALRVEIDHPEDALDMCGTGGDGANTFNITTACMFLTAAAGVPVAKHGNRSASSPAGNADALEALGAKVEIPPEKVAECLRETGIGFMFAPYHHKSMKNIAHIRKALGVRTIFNILGPLTNPANAANQIMGVFHPDLVGIQPRVLRELGSRHVMIIHGMDGMDEASLGADTMVGELIDGEIKEYRIHPEDFGFQMHSNRSFKVSTREESVSIIRDILDNHDSPAKDIVLLNSGIAIYAGNKAASIEEGIEVARSVLQNGAAKRKLKEFVDFTQNL